MNRQSDTAAQAVDGAAACEALVRAFLASWSGADLETIVGYFAPDAVYHNVPVQPIRGLEGIRKIFDSFLMVFAESRLEVVTLAAGPGLVIAERVDHFVMRDGKRIALPVTGVFEVRNGRIQRFSDYFDLADFERQSGLRL